MGCTIKRNWLLGGYTAEYSYARSLDAVTLSSLIHALLPLIARDLAFSLDEAQAIDIKGRNQFDALLPQLPPPHRDEIFRVGGVIATSVRGTEFDWSPFEISCHAEFKDFVNTHHIRHTLRARRSASIPEWLPWRLLGAAAPLRPRYLRLGLEHFQSRFTVASFGYIPQVTDSFILDASAENLLIRFTTEQKKWRPANPLAEIQLFQKIVQAITPILGEDLSQSFALALREKGRFC